MRSTLVRVLVAALALGLVATACSKKKASGEGKASTITIKGEKANNKGTADVSGKSTFALEADTDNGLNYFNPTILKGTPGQSVTLSLKNESSSVKHNFTLADQNLNVDLDPGKSQIVSVTFPASGFLEFHCEYHQGSGMVGELAAT